MNCIFCKIIKGNIPSHKILEGKSFYSFLDINPIAPGHTLVIPKHHCEKLHQLPAEEAAEIGGALVQISKAIGADNYNILQNNGQLAHQEVQHVHFHIIPKPQENIGLGIKWPMQKVEQSELKKLAEEIKGRL